MCILGSGSDREWRNYRNSTMLSLISAGVKKQLRRGEVIGFVQPGEGEAEGRET